MCTLGLAEELRDDGIAANSLWPRTIIATAAVQNLLGGDEAMARSRSPEIMADAAAAILARPSREATGNFYIDDEVLAEEGVTDLDKYGYGGDQTDLLAGHLPRLSPQPARSRSRGSTSSQNCLRKRG